jgi:hypothetical protein
MGKYFYLEGIIMITKFLKYSLSLVLILSCAGCLKKPINLKPLTKECAHDTQTKELVTVHAKKLSFENQKELFGNDAKQLAKHHIIPVQITIENGNKTAWILSNQNISLKVLNIDEVNKILFASRRWLPLSIFLLGIPLSIIAGPIIAVAICNPITCPCCIILPAIIASSTIFAATSCIAIADGIANHMSKKQMHKYLKTCCNMDGITINSDINASMLFFVEESQLPEKLNLLLVDKNIEKNTLPFELNL